MTSPAYAVINLDALQHNLQIVQTYAPKAKIMPVIKANAYGHGMLRVAAALNQSADAFAVARVDEGVRLRKAGINKRITVLEGFNCKNELDDLLTFHLDTVVHSSFQLSMLEARPEINLCKIWLKLDTGMNRLGFKPDDFVIAYQRIKRCALTKGPINIMTHLANADNQQDATTLKQTTLFNKNVASLLNIDAEGAHSELSIANSAGILAWPATLTDWVRPGIMLYGISPFPEDTGIQWQLQPVMSLHSRLIAVKSLIKGDKVGYSGTWTCTKPTLLGIVAIGYGDGYPRHTKEGTPVLVNGHRVPLIGKVSMDMITVDLESQPQAIPGDCVTLWGDGLAIEEIAECSNTIPYTLVCGITQRVRIVEQSDKIKSEIK